MIKQLNMTKCNLCQKDFHKAELTTLNQVIVCKICKVRALQNEFRTTCMRQGGRIASETLTEDQEIYITENYKFLTIKQLAVVLKLKENTISWYIKKNKLKKRKLGERKNK